jgi:hypothetical protein
MLCRTDRHGLTLEAQGGEVAVRYQAGGGCPADAIAFQASVLAELEGGTDAPVTLEQTAAGKGVARWSERTVPRILEFSTVTPESLPAFPKVPAKQVTMPDDFLAALDAAVRTTAREGVRFALTRVLLRGKSGEMLATDGRQLLVQGGFDFPWQEDVLVPRLPVFGHRELTFPGPANLGRTDRHVALCLGPWTFLLAIDTVGRFPDLKGVIPPAKAVTCRLQLHQDDSAFLAATLPKLPGRNESNAPVTLDLAATVAVRARDDETGSVTEALLSRSNISGTPTRLVLNRQLLLRVVQMGFAEVQVASAEQPLQCRDGQRLYAVMPQEAKGAIPPDGNALRIASADDPIPTPPTASPEPERRISPMPDPTNGRTPANPSPERGGINDLINEAEELRTLLNDATIRVGRLLAALKQHRRQARAVQAAAAALQQMKLDR